MPAKKTPPKRLDRETWLARALNILALEGGARLRVDTICASLGVTKGSFYWHFKNRDDFVKSVVQFWSTRFTEAVVAHVSGIDGGAKVRLKALMRFVSDGGFARYDVSIRAWALQDPELVAAIVKDVDERRLAFVGTLLAEMGFRTRDARMRARACVGFLSYEAAVLATSSDKERRKMLDQFFDLITRGA